MQLGKFTGGMVGLVCASCAAAPHGPAQVIREVDTEYSKLAECIYSIYQEANPVGTRLTELKSSQSYEITVDGGLVRVADFKIKRLTDARSRVEIRVLSILPEREWDAIQRCVPTRS